MIHDIFPMKTAMVETLILRTTAWEAENNRLFMYDGVCSLY
jgi:hypothetical protein